MTDGADPHSQATTGPEGAAAPDGAAAPAAPPPTDAVAPPPSEPGDVALLGLVDRLAALLERSELTELEVQVGGTGLVLRKPVAIEAVTVAASTVPAGGMGPGGTGAPGHSGGDASAGAAPAAPARPSVKAPLTGIWYATPSTGSEPYVSVGGEEVAGQVIGLIEAIKLFTEIKSDLSGRVVRIHAENSKLVKARQPLIEVDLL